MNRQHGTQQTSPSTTLNTIVIPAIIWFFTLATTYTSLARPAARPRFSPNAFNRDTIPFADETRHHAISVSTAFFRSACQSPGRRSSLVTLPLALCTPSRKLRHPCRRPLPARTGGSVSGIALSPHALPRTNCSRTRRVPLRLNSSYWRPQRSPLPLAKLGAGAAWREQCS